MLRLVLVVFFGAAKSDASQQAQESPPVMAWPLRVLAVFSIVGGIMGLEGIYTRQFAIGGTLHPLSLAQRVWLPFAHSPLAASAGLLAATFGFAAAYALYAGAAKDPLPEMLGGLSRAMRNRFYLDEIYEATVIRFHDWLSAVADWFDRWLIAGLIVRGTHGTTEFVGRALRLLQTGNLQTYAFLFALGVAVVLYLALK
jgi:NADH-quinone oxidoreductase subunit L